MKSTKLYSKLLFVKSAENNLFFYLFLPDYVSHERLKEFCKNSHFENMRAGFLNGVKAHLGKLTPK